VAGIFADGNHGGLCQRRRRRAAEHRGQMMKEDLLGFAAFFGRSNVLELTFRLSGKAELP
jgi:hypothetical protein